MKAHEQILKMIEEVSPDDTKTLDEIDARVWCWLNNYEFVKVKLDFPRHPDLVDLVYFKADDPKYDAGNYSDEGMISHGWNEGDLWWAQRTNFLKPHGTFKGYTRSRDALKDIRPNGWACQINWRPSKGYATCVMVKGGFDIDSPDAKTEELAELHTIIQAIAYERGE